jgi:hypothetical protein
MRKGGWAGFLALAWLLGGCCGNQGTFQKVEQSFKTVQDYYAPLVQSEMKDEKVRQAILAADTTLLLAAELQKQWCPDSKAAEQVKLQAEQAAKLAQEVGAAPVASPSANSETSSAASPGDKGKKE